MVIRSPKSTEEVLVAADVAAAAFANEAPEWWRERYALLEQRFGREAFLTVAVDGRVVSSCTCLPTTVWVGRRCLSLGAVGGVATLPECRRQGYAGALMTAVVRHMAAAGLATSALWPFSFAYYRKFGWDYGSEQRTYRFAPDQIGALPEPVGVSPVQSGDLPALVEVFRAYAQHLAFCTARTEAWWQGLLLLEGVPPFATGASATRRMLVCREEDRLLGYAVYQPPAGDPPVVNVKELVALTPTARGRLLAAIAQEAPAEITFPSPAEDHFRAQVPNPRAVATSLDPGFSFRVNDLPAALGILSPPPELRGALALTVHDPARPETPLRACVVAHGGQVEIDTATASLNRAPLRLTTDVPTFSQIYAGALRPGTAAWLDRLEGDAESIAFAERFFPRRRPFRSMMEPG